MSKSHESPPSAITSMPTIEELNQFGSPSVQKFLINLRKNKMGEVHRSVNNREVVILDAEFMTLVERTIQEKRRLKSELEITEIALTEIKGDRDRLLKGFRELFSLAIPLTAKFKSLQNITETQASVELKKLKKDGIIKVIDGLFKGLRIAIKTYNVSQHKSKRINIDLSDKQLFMIYYSIKFAMVNGEDLNKAIGAMDIMTPLNILLKKEPKTQELIDQFKEDKKAVVTNTQ